ncbi:MAG: hypothetical protein JWR69_2480 [Pedosphaera sp.]|nr:hypothetical protein [Pedosphaera sp.]
MKLRLSSFALVLLAFFCARSLAHGGDVLSKTSPKLRQFLADHPRAATLLTNALAEAFTNRTVQIYYFYSDDEFVPSAFHYYPSENQVVVALRENEMPLDEFILLTFEIYNSQSEKSFAELSRRAKAGAITRADYAREVLRVEFKAVTRIRESLQDLKFTRRETGKSRKYKRFADCPSTFDDFLAYTQAVNSTNRNVLNEYQHQYDLLRGSATLPAGGRFSGNENQFQYDLSPKH